MTRRPLAQLRCRLVQADAPHLSLLVADLLVVWAGGREQVSQPIASVHALPEEVRAPPLAQSRKHKRAVNAVEVKPRSHDGAPQRPLLVPPKQTRLAPLPTVLQADTVP